MRGRLLTRALLCKFAAGTADVLFAPLARELSARGVAFKYFHRVTGFTA